MKRKEIQCKIGKTINVIGLSLIAGWLCFSCTKDSTPGGGNGKGSSDGEEGLLSLSLKIDATANAGEEPGTNGENNIKNIRVILYAADGLVDKAEYIFDYNLPDGAPSGLITKGNPNYQTKAQTVKRKDYRLVVLVNYFNPAIPATQNILATATAAKGHPITAVTNPVNYYGLSAGTWKGTAFNFLTGYDDSTPVTGGNDPASGVFFMSNANNVAQITESMIRISESVAEDNPVAISVERAVAKVSVAEGAQLANNLARGAELHDFSWRVDIMNMQMYPLRRITYTAPYGAGKGAMENSASLRKDSYAQDPNFDNVSRERNLSAGGSALNVNFERITDGPDPRTGKQYFGQLFMAAPAPAVLTNKNFEYVLENTMEAAEQYQDVTTRVLLRGNYVPPPTTVPEYFPPRVDSETDDREALTVSFAPGQSYFSYNGVAFSAEQMRLMFTDPDHRIPDDPRLKGLYDIFEDFALNPDYGNPAKGFDIRVCPFNPFFNGNWYGSDWGEIINGLPNYYWNQKFFDEFGVTVGNNTTVTSTDLINVASPGVLSSIPSYDATDWSVDPSPNYHYIGEYDPEAPGFTNAFTEYIPNPLKEEFKAVFPWVFPRDNPDATPVAKSWNGINFHLNGISYYSIQIRHFDNAQSPLPMGYGRYGVVRNNHYKIVVNSVSGPGSGVIPTPGGGNDENKWISVRVEVMPWLMRAQEMPLQ